jgi:drug/metabolite transporter (DMT)-like permease
MSHFRLIILTLLAMLAFAGNSLLCRFALTQTSIDAASFTIIRITSGAIVLWLIGRMRHGTLSSQGSWLSALALFVYAAGFSFAYTSLTTATGALLLFDSVQVTMISYGVWTGESFSRIQVVGFAMAFGGLFGFLLPGISAPPILGAFLMSVAGVAWGIYSLRGKGTGNATLVTAGNFLRAIPFALALYILNLGKLSSDTVGVCYAISSGALASGIGYAIWYTALPRLTASHAATVQLSVPVIAALGGIVFLNELITLRFVIAAVFVLGGIALVIKPSP